MEQPSDQSQYMSVEDIRNNPELIAKLLLDDQDVSLIFEKRGDKIRYSYLKTYDEDSIRILREAKNEHQRLLEKGYTRDRALKNFEEARDGINKHS